MAAFAGPMVRIRLPPAESLQTFGSSRAFQLAEVAVPRQMFAEILSLIARLRAPPALA